jgi:hypothetical protein
LPASAEPAGPISENLPELEEDDLLHGCDEPEAADLVEAADLGAGDQPRVEV